MGSLSYKQYLDVAESRDTDTFRARMIGVAEHVGFSLVNATLVEERPGASPAIFAIRNSPASMSDNAVLQTEDAARRDPVIVQLKASSAPFIYDQALYVAHDAADLWEEQAPYGYRTGISMALHLSGGKHFLLGVDREEALPSDESAVVRMMADLQLLAVFAQETALRLMTPMLDAQREIPTLSAREQSILQWTLVGKSNPMIAEILGISISTVNFHLKSAMNKLGVYSKHQAAAKALSLGLIHA